MLTDDEDIGFGDSPEDMDAVRKYNDRLLKEIKMDKSDRKTNFNCDSCMYYVPKKDALIGGIVVDTVYGRCRRHAPTMKGFPVVWASDSCGEHKIGSNPVRDAGKQLPDDTGTHNPKTLRFCRICDQYWDTNAKVVVMKPDNPFLPIARLFCPKCAASVISIEINPTPQEIKDQADAQSRG